MTQPAFDVSSELDLLLARVREQPPLQAAALSSQFLEWIQNNHANIGELRRMSVAKAAEQGMKHSEVAAEMNTRVTTVRRLIAESRQSTRREDEPD